MDTNDTDIIVTITDNGKGIAPDELQHVAESLKERPGIELNNTRIGLSNVNDRLRLIFGNSSRVTVSSILNVGTTVEIKLPAKTTEELKDHV
jgi:two-component system sensor histidine kinase YesM